jgi:uncharacterized protein
MKTKNTSGSASKRPPQRTCVACHRTGAKKGLVRLVRTTDGSLDIDGTGKKAGRGAYLCLNKECWETGISGGKLEYSLKITLSPETRRLLLERGQDLIGENVIG